jgi:hypothetical protein
VKIKSVYAKKEEIPEGKDDLFIEQDGKWVLDTDVDEHPAVQGLKSAYGKEQERRKAQGTRLKAFEALGHEPDDLEKVIEMAESAAGGKKGAADLATWKEQTVKAHKAQTDKLTAGIQKRDAVLGQILGENELRKELGPKALSMTALLAIAKPLVKVEFDEETGQASVAVIDEKGIARVANGQGQPFTIKDLVAELEAKDDLKALFKGTDKRGSGASGEKGQQEASKTIPFGDSKAFLANLDGIAKGDVAVQGG